MIPDTHNGGYLGPRRTTVPTVCGIPDVQDCFMDKFSHLDFVQQVLVGSLFQEVF